MKQQIFLALRLATLPVAALLAVACSDSDAIVSGGGGGTSGAVAGGSTGGGKGGSDAQGGSGANQGGINQGGANAAGANAASANAAGEGGDSGVYEGPSVGRAKVFAALAYSAVTAANISPVTGAVGVSAAATSSITGFDGASDTKYGNDSLPPNSQLTILAQQDVTALVGNIDPRACDVDLTDVVGGLSGDITLHPGVTCMNSFSADVLLNGHVTLDAGGDPNAFFIIRSNLTLTAADAAQVVLSNGAQACGVFWRVKKQVTIGKAVAFYGTIIAGTAITMNSGSRLVGRALAQTAGVMLDANTITIPTDATCSHLQ